MYTWCGDVLILKGFDGQDSSIGSVSVIGSSSSIQLLRVVRWWVKHRVVGWKAFVPSNERRLLVVMSIEKEGFIDLSFHLDEDQGSEVFFFVRYHFDCSSFYSWVLDPFFDMLACLDQFIPALFFPFFLRVESFAHVFNFDIVYERGESWAHELLFDKSFTLFWVEFSCLHTTISFK